MKIFHQVLCGSLLAMTLACSDSGDSKKEVPRFDEDITAPEDGELGPVNFAYDDGEPLPVFIRGTLNEWGGNWNGNLALAQASGSQLLWSNDCYQGRFSLPEGETIFKFASNDSSWRNLNIGGYNFQDGSDDIARSTVVLDEEFALNVDYQPARGVATGNPAALRITVPVADDYTFQICFRNRDLFQSYLTITTQGPEQSE